MRFFRRAGKNWGEFEHRQKTSAILRFCKIIKNCLGAKRLGIVFFRYNPRFFEVVFYKSGGLKLLTQQVR